MDSTEPSRAGAIGVGGEPGSPCKIGDPRSHAQIGFYGWGLDYLNAASFIQPTFTCEAAGRPVSANTCRFCSPELDHLVGPRA